MTSDTAECQSCGASIDVSLDEPGRQAPCGKCGSTARNYNASIVETLVARDGIGVKAKREGERKPYVEDKAMPSFSFRLGKYVLREQLIDRVNDRYSEKITDYETGEILHQSEEPLSQHRGHGSAKPKTKPKPEAADG